MKSTETILYDKSTEEKIKITAERLFMEKGFSKTRTRDIADAADINLALLNYYYRSKKNLFDTIMMEKLEDFFEIMIDVLRNTKDLTEALQILVGKYSDLMTTHPYLSYFLMGELQQNPDFFTTKLNIRAKAKDVDLIAKGKISEIQLFVDFMSLTLYPFIIKRAVGNVFELTDAQIKKFFDDRKERVIKILFEIHKQQI